MTAARLEETAALGLVSSLALAAFVAPLVGARSAAAEPTALLTGLICAAVAVLLALGLRARHMSTRLLAVLAALAAVDATLRALVVIGIWGFTPIFLLMLTAGFVFGPSFGFALGALTMLLSAVVTAGIGPWLPYEMLGAGLTGMTAGILGLAFQGRPLRWPALLALAGLGLGMGFVYGMLLDIWAWPLLLTSPGSSIGWRPGLSPLHLVQRFGVFYLATSLVYDAARAAGNLLLILLLGPPLLAALHRFKLRFLVQWDQPWPPVTPVTMVDHERRAPGTAGGSGTNRQHRPGATRPATDLARDAAAPEDAGQAADGGLARRVQPAHQRIIGDEQRTIGSSPPAARAGPPDSEPPP
jgi:energy-coupling factor transport system substrate-specific component